MKDLKLSQEDAVRLGAEDGLFFAHWFFPKVFNLEPAKYHPELWECLCDSKKRYVGFSVHRDAAKTTILRAYTAQRIAYGLSKTIMFTSETRDHAKRSLSWLSNQIKTNRLFAETFGLEIGETDNKYELVILHHGFKDEYENPARINVVAQGMTGQIRGINIEDSRPDLIICDDPCNEENTGTEEQRQKLSKLFFGALLRSLTASKLNPHAKAVLLQTRLHKEDLFGQVESDPLWECRQYSCYMDDGESAWPSKWTTNGLNLEKDSYASRNQLSVWYREMECKLVAPEENLFRPDWLNYWTHPYPDDVLCFMGIDPVPKPTERQMQLDLRGKDYEALSVIGVSGGKYYVLETVKNRGHDPSWTVAEFFRLARKYRVLAAGVDSNAYQSTLAWLLDKAQREHKANVRIEELSDRRKKTHRIAGALQDLAFHGDLYVHKEQNTLITQFCDFPSNDHDDVIESVALAIMTAQSAYAPLIDNIAYDMIEQSERDIPEIPQTGWAP